MDMLLVVQTHYTKMKTLNIALVVLLLISTSTLKAQESNYEYLFKKGDTLITDIQYYGGFTHQHHDFFNKAFSFQGIETGFIFNRSLFAGVYGSTFVSNLEVEMVPRKMYFSLAQAGLVLGVIYNSPKFIHTGLLLNIGYLSIVGGNEPFPLFIEPNPGINISGAVIAPQAFAEVNILKWLKVRTGIEYNFYRFEDQSVVTRNDVQNVSFTFGFFFGAFSK